MNLNKAVKYYPDDAKIQFYLGLYFVNNKQFNEAEKAYKKAIVIDSVNIAKQKNVSIKQISGEHFYLGLLLFNLRRYNEAEKEFIEVIRINPNDVGAHYNLAIIYQGFKEYNDALREFESILKLSPNNPDIQNKVEILKQIVK